MKKIFKTIAWILALSMVILTFTACKGTEKQMAEDTPTAAPQDTSADTSDDAAATDAAEPTATQAPVSDEPVTITFAHWGLGTEEENNIERRMIAAYEEAHPNVTVEIAEDIITSDNWNNALATAAAGGTMPDVVMIAALPDAVSSSWALDVSSMVANDEDWAKIPSYLSNSGAYGSGQYGIPYAMNLAGYFINTDLFAAENVTPLSYGYTLTDWEDAVAAMSSPSKGVIALKNADIIDWYPAVKDSTLGWFTYNGSEVNLENPVFIEGVKYANSLNTNGYAFNGLTEDQKSNFGVPSDWEAWNAGKVAMAYDGTWVSGGASTLPFKMKFVGLPDSKSVIIPDYIYVGSTTEHPDVAYDFAKWMSFSKEGIMKRLDIVEANEGVTWSSLPLIIDSEIMDRYFAKYPVEGVKEVFADLEGHSFAEAFKFTPGYTNARWEAPTGIAIGDNSNAKIADVLNACMAGTLNIDDYAAQLNTLSNQYISEGWATINSVVPQ